MTHSYQHNHEALVSELTDKELSALLVVASEEWRRRRKASEENQAEEKVLPTASEADAPDKETIAELRLIRDDLIDGKAIPRSHRQFVRSVELRYPDWVKGFGLPARTSPDDWVYARMLLQRAPSNSNG
ncbi:hypothetical protein [Salinicola salarius]|uniref:hypothetical protein n=1 Tax=Salinicola salarius TaxID=430457 RepID=UPI000DA133A0|nr:hypothetical protein [Salinicola salarius]